ncbi:flippase-like domain-containing protein [Conexibacter sp. SYSU D00693]|uniref:flippase-like domain-containing protein n=1 Tax=Conexibacter sp. SYSU D00693 TaxID=2812560 RepID=UPI00196BAE3E|nr:flippase-like domain-containing protein [Conexibacter sp. SYSU D00693]
MRIALLSPYSWTYPGGVTRHIEALAGELHAGGHDVHVLAPYDPPDDLSARLHRGARPQERELPEWVVPLGRTVGFPANGAISNLAITPASIVAMRRALAELQPDVVHVHEPVAPVTGWDALLSTDAPLVGTFHCYSANAMTNGAASLLGARRRLNRLRVRIAVSEAAAWTGRRFYGGRYRVIPNGVTVPDALPGPREDDGVLRLAFVGQAVERKGLPVLLRAFEALREHVPAELTVVGAGPEELEPLLLDARGVTALGKVDDAEKERALRAADLLVAPSLGGESFGMVLTEAFAAGRPVVASDIAGYRDVVRDGVDGLLVPRGDAQALAERLRELALDAPRRRALARGAAEAAPRYAWPRVAADVVDAYEDAIAVPEPEAAVERFAWRRGFTPADRLPAVRATRLPTLEPAPIGGRKRIPPVVRRGLVLGAAAGAVGLAFAAIHRIGAERIGDALIGSSPSWVLAALALMCLSMVVRAVSWHAILQAALPASRPRLRDALQGTMIGVLMSATLPARLGEPARAMVVARRLGGARGLFPAVLGTIVSQALVNVLALVLLGAWVLGTVDYFDRGPDGLWVFTALPIAVLFAVLALPSLLRSGAPSRFKRVEAFGRKVHSALVSVRGGLVVFRRPKLGSIAVATQLLAWAIQLLSCYVLLVAFGLDEQAGLGAAAAVLFAVNVSAVLPATPSNLGVFQAACVFVLHRYGIGTADALGYGIVLQAVEIATAFVMGLPALVGEGVSWKDVRLRALHASPVELQPLPTHHADGTVEAEA